MIKEGETVTSELGGKQAFVAARMDLIPATALRLVGECAGFGGRKYGADNWKQIPPEENLNHAMLHLVRWQEGDRGEPHLVNAAIRTMFALQQAVDSGDQVSWYNHPEITFPV